MVHVFGLLLVAGCSSSDFNPGEGVNLVATPTQLFLEVGESKTVDVAAVDNEGNPVSLNFEVTSPGSGIDVRRDSTFLPVYVDDSTLQVPAEAERFRFLVTGQAYTSTSFVVSAGGADVMIPVQVTPLTGVTATFDNATPALGDTVTLTAPAGVTFNPDATLEIAGNPLLPLIVSQDASTIRFIPPPNVNAPVTIHGVVSASAPDLVFDPATETSLVTPVVDTVDVTYSNATPAVGETVTMTVTEPLIDLVVDSIIYPGQLPGRAPGPQNIVVAADSNSLTFAAPPNAAGSGTVVNFAFPGGFLIALPTRPSITAGNIGTTLAATASNLNPAVSETVTLTAPAGFTFDPATTVTIGGQAAIISAVGGNTVSFIPLPGSTGVPEIDGVVPTASPSNILTMSTPDAITVPSEVPTLPGTGTPGTAPSLTTPAEGALSVLFDNPSLDIDPVIGPSAYYALTITQAGSYDITMDWNVGSDIDMFVCPAATVGDFDCDFQAATGAHPENGVYDLTPGDYFVVANDFGVDATGTTLVITIVHNPPAAGAGLRMTPLANARKAARFAK
jgi:hypothetical protein